MNLPARPTARRGGIPLGRPFGVPVYLAPSWLFIAAFVIAGAGAEPAVARLGAARWVVAVGAALIVAVSIVAHELGHAAVSMALGVPVRRITVFLLGGLAEIEREPETPVGEYLVAIAGPLVSLVLAGAGVLGWRLAPEDSAPAVLAFYLAAVNTGVALLNLMPGLPLDGGRVLRAAVWQVTRDKLRSTTVAVRGGQVIACAVLALGAWELSAGRGNGVITLVVGAFLWVASIATLHQARTASRIPGVSAAGLVRPAITVTADVPLAEALRKAHDANARLLVVDAYGRPSGVISAAAVQAVPAHRFPWVTVGSVTAPVTGASTVNVGLAGEALIESLQARPADEYVVVDDSGSVIGVLAARDVVRVVQGAAR
ncbi:MAG TPA: site-2 protease family protein [Mycobacteriales bacterium]|nr:site-2 protease family protein [Mycobacteriales bacterium]